MELVITVSVALLLLTTLIWLYVLKTKKLKQLELILSDVDSQLQNKVGELEEKTQELANAQMEVKELQLSFQVKNQDFESLYEKYNELQTALEKYKPIQEIENTINKRNEELQSLKSEAESLNEKFKAGKDTLSRLEQQISIYEDDMELMDFGVYQPIFDLDTSDEYKMLITEAVNRQKDLVQRDLAAICNTEWHVKGSAKEGELMILRFKKLMLRAFNGEADALIAKVKWNNVKLFKSRIIKAYETINRLSKSNDTYIVDTYLQLKLDELHLIYELQQKLHEEREEQRSIREQMREEERAQRELEKAQKEAENEERRYQEALERAYKAIEVSQGEELDKLNSQITNLQEQLEQAHQAKERAIARAQMTKSGHVYVISNIGSFGENVYKIGMTRRLEPTDRVKELGDASVPFSFDIHAIIYSDNAPELENILHRSFRDKRVNMMNYRKEFFNVNLEEIEKVINESTNAEIHFTKVAEAKEYRETEILSNQLAQVESIAEKVSAFPESLF